MDDNEYMKLAELSFYEFWRNEPDDILEKYLTENEKKAHSKKLKKNSKWLF
jgi:hypothetical protein